MTGQYVCSAPGRVDALREAALASPPRLLNGITYLEVLPGQRRLEVHFVHPLDWVPAAPLTLSNIEIRGGVRVRDPQATGISWHDDVLVVDVATAGDFSRYVLRLVASAGQAAPPAGIDPALAQVAFSFKVDCPSDFDCRTDTTCPPEPRSGPAIDYLARDYASFRRLLLDRLSALMPDWRERHAADLMVTLAEALAFRGDELSYFQDAVNTTAEELNEDLGAGGLAIPETDPAPASAFTAPGAAPSREFDALAGRIMLLEQGAVRQTRMLQRILDIMEAKVPQ